MYGWSFEDGTILVGFEATRFGEGRARLDALTLVPRLGQSAYEMP